MNRNRFISALLLMVIVCSIVLVGTARFGIAQVENWIWSRVENTTDQYFQSIDMIDSTDGWAVGSEGAIIRWDVAKWNNVASPTIAWLSFVDMINCIDGWIVGADGIYHWQKNGSGVPNECLVIMGVFVVVLVIWLFLIKRHVYKQSLNK